MLLPFEIQTIQDIKNHIAMRFKELRISHFNLSRQRLADQSGVSKTTIQRFEEGGTITLDNLLLLAKTLNAESLFLELFPMPSISSIKDLKKKSIKRHRPRIKGAKH